MEEKIKFAKTVEEFEGYGGDPVPEGNEQVSRAIARSFDLGENCFLDGFGSRETLLARPDLILGLNVHSDGTGYTIILQDTDVEGLQVLTDDQWQTVPTSSNALLVLMGDHMEIMSNGVFKGPVHRVLTSWEKERISLVVFHTPEPQKRLDQDRLRRLFKKVTDDALIHWGYYQQASQPTGRQKLKSRGHKMARTLTNYNLDASTLGPSPYKVKELGAKENEWKQKRDSGDKQRASKYTRQGLNTKECANNKGSEHHKGTRGNHLPDGCISRDLDAGGIIRLGSALHKARNGVELPANLFHHLQSCTSHTLHSHSREPIWEHGTNNQTNEDLWCQDINHLNTSTTNKSTEQGQGNQCSRSNGKSLRMRN
ncbi:Isopenicillin N synthase-like, Fe(2+) 2OG dioxygenase domain [Dillenia turbinata]|uniref:Isopenicillin N synthase-like, Fe(2+) 2OG dioxygenase domain n=1 Tax=Dillenia turbinata TaxID=194707 RepID=A0AAN8YWP0_9MAGN